MKNVSSSSHKISLFFFLKWNVRLQLVIKMETISRNAFKMYRVATRKLVMIDLLWIFPVKASEIHLQTKSSQNDLVNFQFSLLKSLE